MPTMTTMTLLGVALEKTGTDDYSFHGITEDRKVRMVVGRIDWPVGTPRPWYAAAETIPCVHGSPGANCNTAAWRFEGPFCATPEEAVAAFELVWDAARLVDRRCVSPGPVVG